MNEESASAKSRLRCRDIMTGNVLTTTIEMALKDAAHMMKDGDIGVLPVVERETNKLVGIITDRDIVVRVVAAGKGADATVAEAMTTELFTAKPDDFAYEAIRTMGERQVRRIPIVDDAGILQGIVSMADIALEMEDEHEIAETLEEISSGTSFWKKG
jgi:CBS domain-containing protein